MSDNDFMDIGLKVKSILDDKRMTAAELSRMTGIHPSLVSKLLKGQRRWNQDQILSVSKALGVKPVELLDEKYLEINEPVSNNYHFDGAMNLEILTLAIKLTEDFVKAKRLPISPERKSRLITKLYEHWIVEQEIPTPDLTKFYFLLT
jgi:transcriptional regulator with XRE-family HTH domain